MTPSRADADPSASHGAAAKSGGEIRLSFGLFYLVLKWGREQRSADRLKDERRRFPVVTTTHAPVLIAIYALVLAIAYGMLVLGLNALSWVAG